MSKTSLTAAGQTDAQAGSAIPSHSAELSAERRDALIDAINQVFTLFRVNFHNQYYKAYADDGALLSQAKKLWFESLKPYEARVILEATKSIIEETEYLPTLHQMLSRCAQANSSAPSPHQAYVEACNAASPKAQQNWSHPAVYEAGRRSDWFFLSTTAEHIAFPVFKNHYQDLLNNINEGAALDLPAITEQPKHATEQAVSKAEGLKHLDDLKKSLDL